MREKGRGEKLTPIIERTGIKPEETEAGGERRRTEGGGGKQKEGLEPGLGLGRGGRDEDELRAKNKGPSWTGRPFGNKVLALFYFPT